MRLPADLASKIRLLARRLNIKEEDIVIFGLKQHVEILESTYNQVEKKYRKKIMPKKTPQKQTT